MSQAGLIDILTAHPEIPVFFETDDGEAVAIDNTLEILGAVAPADSDPVFTTGSGNTITVKVQTTQEIIASDATKIGLAAFDSVGFNVDANGFVTLAGGGGATTNIDVDASTPPGTDPVVPNAGNIIMTGDQVGVGVVGANVLRTNSLAANTVTYEIQQSGSAAAENTALNGVSHFNSGQFSVSNGFVSLLGGGEGIDSIAVQTGTTPIVPTVAGLVTINGAVVAAGTNPIRSDGTGANTLALEVQISQAIAATDATKIGLSNFNSAQFSVDANGFVSLAGGGEAIDSIAVQTGTSPIVPTAGGLVTINGAVVAAGTNPLRSNGTGANTLALEVQISQALAAADATKIGLSNFSSAGFGVAATGFVTLATSVAQLFTANTGSATPSSNNLNVLGGGGIQTSGSGATLTIAVSGGGFTWVDATSATQALAVQTGYVTDRGGGVTYTLPATAVLGDTIKIVGKLGLATITPNANQQILIGSASGAVGVTGTAASNNVGDCLELICITAGASTVWRADSVVGTWTLTT